MRGLLLRFAIFISMFSFTYAQQTVPFTTQKAFYIYGDAAVIGNNILSKDKQEPYNDYLLTNDDIDMVYVDIDQDKTTFSSSSANLKLPDNQSKIAYAVLYWSATYSYIKGTRREEDAQFYFQGNRQKNRSLINKVKLKLPGENYQNITGNVLFDGAKNPAFALNAPYVCFADVTKQLQEVKQVNGEYTVANINATQGYVAGGSAAGWMLYVVYEAPTSKPKYITTFNGFSHIGNQPEIISLDDFKTPDKGATSTAIVLATLEGDSALSGDQCIVANPVTNKAWQLQALNRDKDNFFSSQITSVSTANTVRYPNSSNTLGFDLATVTLPNNDEAVIVNGTEKVDLIFNTKQDRFYLFFTAFNTEISESFFKEIQSNTPVNAIVLTSEKLNSNTILIPDNEVFKSEIETIKTISKTDIKTIGQAENYNITTQSFALKQPVIIKKELKQELVVPMSSEIISSKSQNEALAKGDVLISSTNYVRALKIEDKPLETQAFKLLLEKNAALIEGAKEGYYVINKFFSESQNAINWQKYLKEKGYDSQILIDETEQLFYVYVFHTQNFYDAYMQHKTLLNNALFSQNWVFKVNMIDY
ncbi:hypothetical protein [Olleya sp. UBA1516]|uniref:hypothetical protein n=1 Tax=Olleya sp. UBA1516 TaxID=1947013 RepID=UPI0025F21490|nr:hypothetical protein [Olleya sp. UBA1516]|tara:strand:+ start:2421 stop:4190 length:1770 start_codon:yes stop_codon:yes gene_type:complete